MSTSEPAASPPEQLPASLGRYTLQELVGRGAAGVVYRATLNGPAGFRKRLAIKLIAGGSSSEVVSEARLGALLDHPNLIEIYDLTYEPPWWLIAMEWVQGPTLLELLQSRGAMPGRALQQVGSQLASALFHAHALEVDGRAQPIVHRDLKPSNVLLTQAAVVKLADLGLAALAGTAHEHAVGTPGYMAPEQLDAGGTVDPRTDQFALGILLAEMALGRRMVRGKTVDDVQARHDRIGDEIEKGLLQRSIDTVLPGLGDVVARCLVKAADDRFEDCAALGRALGILPAGGASLAEWMTESGSGDEGSGTSPSSVGSTAPGPSGASPGSTPLFGRDEDLGRLATAITSSRLVVLQGPGGVGKSLLARRHAALSERSYAGGAVVCDLATVRDVDGVCAATAAALGLPLGPGEQTAVVSQVGHQLRVRGETLVVIDDADEALDAIREVLEVWMAIATEARFVVTSRAPLRVDGETVVRIEPLAVDDAVALLRDRALRSGGTEAWSSPDAEPVLADLAQQLDRLPLALELAAARGRSLTPSEVLARLADRFRLLGQTEGRHGTLENVLRTSWEQLSPTERSVLAQLSVFRGGFTIEDAERVVERQPGQPWITDLVGAMLERSLLMVRRMDRGDPRFHLYESIRLYAHQQLEHPDRVLLRHAQWFARTGGPSNLISQAQDPLREREAQDLDNFVAGVEAGLQLNDVGIAAGCAVAAGRVILNRGPMRRGLEIVERVLPVAPDHAALLEIAARLALRTDDPRALAWAERARAAATDPRERVASHLAYGRLLQKGGRNEEARRSYDQARDEAHHIGDPVTEGRVALSLGRLLIEGDEDARGQLGFALRVGRLTKHRELTVSSLVALGRLGVAHDDLTGAQRRLEQALEAGEGMPLPTAEAHELLGHAAQMLGDNESAQQHFEASLDVYRRLGLRGLECATLSSIGVLELLDNNYATARDYFEESLTIAIEVKEQRVAANSALNLATVNARMGHVDVAVGAIEQAREQKAAVSTARQLATSDINLALLDLERDRPQEALQRARQSLESVQEIGALGRQMRVGAASVVANAQIVLGAYEQALRMAESAIAESTDRTMMRAIAHLERGCAAAMTGDDEAMNEHLDHAAALADVASDRWLVAYVAIRRAEIAWVRADFERCADLLDALLVVPLGAMHGLAAHARGLRALVAIRRGEPDANPASVAGAIEVLEGLGMKARARRLRESLDAGT